MKRLGIIIFSVLFLSACSTPKVVEVNKVSDTRLTCTQLEAEIIDANRFEQKARDAKGVTGTNVAAAVLFWPAMIGTYKNANDAIDAARDRKAHLMKLRSTKGCR
jgi:hypothetical protein